MAYAWDLSILEVEAGGSSIQDHFWSCNKLWPAWAIEDPVFKRPGKEKRPVNSWAMVAPVFNPSTWEIKAGGSLSSRSLSSTEQVLEQSELLHRKKPYFEKENNNNNRKRKLLVKLNL